MHWSMVERGMEFGWLFIVIFSILIVLGVIHLIKFDFRTKVERTARRIAAPYF